jgi:hypothetical protein
MPRILVGRRQTNLQRKNDDLAGSARDDEHTVLLNDRADIALAWLTTLSKKGLVTQFKRPRHGSAAY